GLQFHIRKHIEMAQNFKDWLLESNDFELFVEPPFNLVCFRHKAGDDFNMKLMNAVNATGKAYFTHTKLNGKVVLRMSIGQTNTDEKHVKATWELIQEKAKSLK
ncbi:MAG TPA: pyridoxal-dependent decarboxylase, partial [Draconibacterium sp.]|nr:pyridoxal-dependent decarboxylase [Draconibacterium sp.]